MTSKKRTLNSKCGREVKPPDDLSVWEAREAVPNTRGCRWVGEKEKLRSVENRTRQEKTRYERVVILLIFVLVWMNYIAIDLTPILIRQ